MPAAQGPADTEKGFVAAVGVFAGGGGGTQDVLGVGDFGIEGGADGFDLLLTVN
jgi:hypothetical protein